MRRQNRVHQRWQQLELKRVQKTYEPKDSPHPSYLRAERRAQNMQPSGCSGRQSIAKVALWLRQQRSQTPNEKAQGLSGCLSTSPTLSIFWDADRPKGPNSENLPKNKNEWKLNNKGKNKPFLGRAIAPNYAIASDKSLCCAKIRLKYQESHLKTQG